MKILIYSVNFAPESIGIGKYSGEMAAWLAAKGYEVRVVSAPPYYPQWSTWPEYRWPLFRRERWQGVEVWRAPLWVPKAPSGLKRVLHLLSFAVSSFPVMLAQVAWRPDMVFTVAPAFVCTPAALLIARLCRAQSRLHIQDFEVDIAFKMNLLKGAMLQRVILRMEGWILKRFDLVSTISQRMVARLLSKGVRADHVAFFPNWVDLKHIAPGTDVAAYREGVGLPADALVVLYSGSLSSKQGLMILPEVARRLAYRGNIRFVICGDGVMKAQLQKACADLPNILLLPLQPFEHLGDLLCMADVHLLPQELDAEDLVLPSKLSGMLASGRPVIAMCRDGSELSTVVSNCGIVVEPGDGAALAAAIVQLADASRLRETLGIRAREYAESNFDRDLILDRFFGRTEDDDADASHDVDALLQDETYEAH